MTEVVNAGTTPKYTANLVDEDGVAIDAASLTTFTITVINLRTGAVINSRNRQNALNVNNVTISAGGLVTWSIQAADLPSTQEEFFHVVFEWTWNAGAKAGWHDFALKVIPVPRPTV